MLVISYGGSLIFNDDGVNPNVSLFAEFLKNRDALVVVGGGLPAREYIGYAKKLGIKDHDSLDEVAIAATRVNATLLQKLAGKSGKIPLKNEELKDEFESRNLVFMGGTVPGQTTDMVALKAAAVLGEKRFYNLTKVDGVFDSDPSKNSDAKLIEKITCSELQKAWGVDTHSPGLNFPIEPLALATAKREGIEMFVLNGNNIENLKSLIEGSQWKGTHILPE